MGDLIALDKPVMGKGTSDPYIKVMVQGKREVFKTQVKKKSLNPVWKESCHFAVHPGELEIVLCLFDSDFGSKDDPMGQVTLQLTDLGTKRTQAWFPVEPEARCLKATGEVHVGVVFKQR